MAFLTKDVWSFGVALWETFSFGKIPYALMTNQEILTNLSSGYRLPQPESCPMKLYKLMLQMWNIKAKGRNI